MELEKNHEREAKRSERGKEERVLRGNERKERLTTSIPCKIGKYLNLRGSCPGTGHRSLMNDPSGLVRYGIRRSRNFCHALYGEGSSI